MPGGVFISYRREDNAFAARAICNSVAQRLERENVFFDVDNIDLGADWVEVLTDRVGACDALVAIIRRNWISSDNRRRLDDHAKRRPGQRIVNDLREVLQPDEVVPRNLEVVIDESDPQRRFSPLRVALLSCAL